VWRRAAWDDLRNEFLRTINTLTAEEEFRGAHQEALAAFHGPSALIAYLASPGGDLDRKDSVYEGLVGAVQANVEWTELASAILWLGLWPGLDAVYRRRLKLFRQSPDEPVSVLSLSFTAAVRRADLSRIKRIAATLVRNTERNLVDEVRRGWRQTANEVGRDADRLEEVANEVQLRSGAPPDALPEGLALVVLRRELLPVVGDDTDLLLAVLVLGENQREAADRLGIRHGTARKRFQRALARAREHFPAGLSHLAPKTGVSLNRGRKRPKGT
jgi:DNA-directed RNA polymerase specialized sigma24 family protein